MPELGEALAVHCALILAEEKVRPYHVGNRLHFGDATHQVLYPRSFFARGGVSGYQKVGDIDGIMFLLSCPPWAQ